MICNRFCIFTILIGMPVNGTPTDIFFIPKLKRLKISRSSLSPPLFILVILVLSYFLQSIIGLVRGLRWHWGKEVLKLHTYLSMAHCFLVRQIKSNYLTLSRFYYILRLLLDWKLISKAVSYFPFLQWRTWRGKPMSWDVAGKPSHK